MSIEGSVERLMVFDANKDDALSANEITDSRLQALWKRADLDGDGKVKRSELVDLLTKEATASESRGGPGGPGGPPPGRGQGGPGGGPGGFGGPPPGQGGPGGPRGPRPNPGEVLPSFFRESLQLTEEQITQLDQLQRDVDERLAKILTAAQREQLRQAPSRGPVRGEPPRRD